MTTKTKAPSRTAVRRPVARTQGGPWLTPPWTTEERLQRIKGMSQQIDEYVQFMCQLGNLNGTSVEAKEKAVAAFYEQMVVMERRLSRIQDELQLE